MRRLIGSLVVMVFALTLMVGFAHANPASNLNDFTDTKDYWAAQVIAQSNALGIVRGYPGNVFKPRDPVIRVDMLIILIRSLGLEEQANAVNVETLNLQFPSDVNYGKGHISLAADRGIIDKTRISSMEFRKPATRLEVAVLTAIALKLPDDPTPLSFTDLGDIPAIYHGKIAALVNKGIMSGTPGNMFEPNRSVTRAEMTSLVGNMLTSGDVDPYPGRYQIAKIISLNPTQGTISAQAGTVTRTYTLASTYRTYRGGKLVSLTGLLPGENAVIVLNEDGKVGYLAYTTAAVRDGIVGTTDTFTGTIQALRLDAQVKLELKRTTGAIVTLPLGAGAKITQNGVTKDLTTLTGGQTVEVKVVNGLVTEIRLNPVTTPSLTSAKSYVVNKYLDYFTVHHDNGTNSQVDLTAGLSFIRNGVTTGYHALSRGTAIELVKSGTTVTAVKILDEPSKVFGRVTSVRSDRFTIKDDDGIELSYDFESNVSIRDEDNRRLEVDEIKVDDNVEAQLSSSGKISHIKVLTSAAELEGIVTYIRTTSSPRIRIELKNGTEKTYYIVSSVKVKRDSTTLDLEDVREGDLVELTLNRNDEVSEINIKTSTATSGTLTDLRLTSSTKRITVERSSSSRTTYDLASNVLVKRGSSTLDLNDLMIGSTVEVKVSSNKVTEIKVTGDQDITIEGEIRRVNTSSKWIEIRQSSGNEFRLYFESSPTIRDEDGSSIGIGDLRNGWEVKLQLRIGDIRRLDVIYS